MTSKFQANGPNNDEYEGENYRGDLPLFSFFNVFFSVLKKILFYFFNVILCFII